jgi:L-iditol 2-dehydrogenase
LRAALLYGPRDLRICKIDRPKPRSGNESLVKVQACGVCSTDLKLFDGTRKPVAYPLTLGHELAGETVGKRKERVVALGRVGCGECRECKAGMTNLCSRSSFIASGFGEYAVYPIKNLIRVPRSLPSTIACLAEPVGCCINGLSKLHVSEKSSVLIIGDGAIGMIFAQLLRSIGIQNLCISGHHNQRLKMFYEFGATGTINSKNLKSADIIHRLGIRDGFDVVIVAAADFGAYCDGLHGLSKRGCLLAFSGTYPDYEIPFHLDTLRRSEQSMIGSYECNREQVELALELMKKGQILMKPIISHVFSLLQLQNAFSLALRREAIKIVIVP